MSLPPAGTDSSCGASTEDCDGACVNTESDRANCGACGVTCLDDEVCEAGLCGLVVEHGTTDEVIFNPQHDYTKRLLADVPDLKGSLKARTWEPGAPAAGAPRPN